MVVFNSGSVGSHDTSSLVHQSVLVDLSVSTMMH